MAIFIAKAIVAPRAAPGVPETYGPTRSATSRTPATPGSPNLHFTDVSPSDSFCKHVHYLWAQEHHLRLFGHRLLPDRRA